MAADSSSRLYLPFWFSKNKRWLEFLLPNCYKEELWASCFWVAMQPTPTHKAVMPRSIQPITFNVIDELDWIDEWNHRHVALWLALYYTELWMNINNTHACNYPLCQLFCPIFWYFFFSVLLGGSSRQKTEMNNVCLVINCRKQIMQ